MDLLRAVREYETSTQLFLGAVDDLRDGQLDRHARDSWSARQIIHHVADSEAQSYARLRRLIAEPPGSVIQGYDEAAWAECDALGYRDLAIEHPLAVFRSVRAASLDVLRRVHEADLDRFAEHSESGRYTLATWIDVYTRHPREHADQLLEAVRA